MYSHIYQFAYVVPSDYSSALLGIVIFTPGGPNEITTQLRVQSDDRLEDDETVPLMLELSSAAVTTGGQIGLRSEAVLTILNDDGKTTMFLKVTN